MSGAVGAAELMHLKLSSKVSEIRKGVANLISWLSE